MQIQELKGRLDNHERRLDNQGKRIGKLEISDAKMGEKIENLIDKLDSLTNWIKALVMICITSLMGFFFWYIQNLKI